MRNQIASIGINQSEETYLLAPKSLYKGEPLCLEINKFLPEYNMRSKATKSQPSILYWISLNPHMMMFSITSAVCFCIWQYVCNSLETWHSLHLLIFSIHWDGAKRPTSACSVPHWSNSHSIGFFYPLVFTELDGIQTPFTLFSFTWANVVLYYFKGCPPFKKGQFF